MICKPLAQKRSDRPEQFSIVVNQDDRLEFRMGAGFVKNLVVGLTDRCRTATNDDLELRTAPGANRGLCDVRESLRWTATHSEYDQDTDDTAYILLVPTSDYVYMPAMRADVAALVPATTRSLLDIGCGTGDFAGLVRSKHPGVELWRMDTAPAVEDAARRQLNHFDLAAYPQHRPDRNFDCITFNDVLEHMIDPWAALDAARDQLNPGGCIIASIPTVRNYSLLRKLVVNGQWSYQDTGILDRTHLRFFTKKSAIDLFEQAALRVVATVPVNVARGGRAVRVLSMMGRWTEEFRSQGYLYVARLGSE